MSINRPIDATRFSYEDWVRFAFDRPIADEPWYCSKGGEFECDSVIVLGYYAQLFRNPVPMLSHLMDHQIEQGVWFAVGHQLREWLWSDDLPIQFRIECINAMPEMFKQFLFTRPLETASWMWWDMLRTFDSIPDGQIVEAMIRAQTVVLNIPVRHCRMSALHGLGHQDHPLRESTIRSFLATLVEPDPELRAYAERAAVGEVL